MTLINIKPYSHLYKDQIQKLIISILTEEFNLPVTLDEQPDLNEINVFYQKDKGNFWVALDGEKVVGTIALIDIGNSQTALRKMFVDKNYRGKNLKIAQSLLDTLLAWCVHKKVAEIYLGTIHIFTAAVRFYEKNKFNEIANSLLPATFPIMPLDNKYYLRKI